VFRPKRGPPPFPVRRVDPVPTIITSGPSACPDLNTGRSFLLLCVFGRNLGIRHAGFWVPTWSAVPPLLVPYFLAVVVCTSFFSTGLCFLTCEDLEETISGGKGFFPQLGLSPPVSASFHSPFWWVSLSPYRHGLRLTLPDTLNFFFPISSPFFSLNAVKILPLPPSGTPQLPSDSHKFPSPGCPHSPNPVFMMPGHLGRRAQGIDSELSSFVLKDPFLRLAHTQNFFFCPRVFPLSDLVWSRPTPP